MEKSEMNMILQAIHELSDKVDQNQSSIQQLSEKVDQNQNSIQQLSEKVDQNQSSIQQLSEKVDLNHAELTKRLDRMEDDLEDKTEYMQHKLMEHDELIFKLKRRAQ
ncbi:hypothetical protein J416_13179 [Gracilibacillus halophilus YIM-C55.5]|uniref:t-SNARE coiled-coil homology domain-containing protein n=1 Tax=Gracilibacillus halophilus YIM-C55.5 TaxID=1308866 RepID=N4WS40_9BACI|nr:hypothetical protein [Gracilibacillus halophilus]ENH95991.1 hypothetical protein J416_13179 [Gracilibacillus halophilus YIM-C55.5]